MLPYVFNKPCFPLNPYLWQNPYSLVLDLLEYLLPSELGLPNDQSLLGRV